MMKRFITVFVLALVVLIGSGALSTALAATCNGVEIAVDVDCAAATNPIYGYLGGVIRFVAGLVGLAVVINIIIGGLQYMTSQGDPGALTKAKNRIFNAVVSLIAFIFAATIINYLIPGGVLS